MIAYFSVVVKDLSMFITFPKILNIIDGLWKLFLFKFIQGLDKNVVRKLQSKSWNDNTIKKTFILKGIKVTNIVH